MLGLWTAGVLLLALSPLSANDVDSDVALLTAVKSGQDPRAEQLLKQGANPNVRDQDGMSALMIAASAGDAGLVRLLMKAGADAGAKRADGATASSIAARQGHPEIAGQIAHGGQDLPAPGAGAQPAHSAPVASIDQPSFAKKARPDDYALVVGVEQYSADLPAAQFADHDARAMRAYLIALGYPERNIRYLSDAKATRARLEAYIERWLPRHVKPGSHVFFYFSGHGAPDPASGKAYLMPFDGDPNFLDKTAYPVARLYSRLNKLPVKRVVVAFDSCFSGSGERSVIAEGARPLVTKVDADQAVGDKVVLFAAASGGQIAGTLKDQAHGIFTYYFLKGLDGAARNRRGAITARSLFEYLRPNVESAASRFDREQTPVLKGALARFVRFE